MKAVILAAGKSQRLRTLGLDIPKPMIEVQGKPLIVHHLENCARNGIREVFINLHHLPDAIQNSLKDGAAFGVKIVYHVEEELLGTSGAVKAFEPYLRHSPFIVLYGDNFLQFELSDLIRAHDAKTPTPDMSMMLFEKEDVSQSGVAVMNSENFIAQFVEKPTHGEIEGHWVNAGAYLMEPRLLSEISEGFSDFGKDVIPDLIRSGRKILGVKTKSNVIAVDTPELLRAAKKQDIPS